MENHVPHKRLSLFLNVGILALLAAFTVAASPAFRGTDRQTVATGTPEHLDPAAHRALQVLQQHGATVAWHERTGVPDFITADRRSPIPLTVAPRPTEKPENVALRFFSEYRALFRMTDPAQELVVKRVDRDALGMYHVRLAQRVGRRFVFGGELIVHLTPDRQIVAVNGKFAPQAKVPEKPTLSLSEAYTRAVQELDSGKGNLRLRTSELLIFNPALLDQDPNRNYLAYRLVIDDPETAAIWVTFIDAETGALLFRYNDLKTTKNRQIYDLNGGMTLPGTLCYDEGGPAGSPSADCIDAFNFSGDTYDYFFSHFGRDSFDDAGATMKASVRYDSMANAFWNGQQTVFGPGWAVKDVVAHEWTHAVTSYTADLIYSFQSGALNESYSDVFAAMIDADDWLMGEDLPNGAIRSLANPTAYGDPGKLSDYVCTVEDNGGVHTNSGIPNHAAYLMAEGGTYNGFTITGIGRGATGAIYYRALTAYLTSTANFGDAYFALLNACTDLYGAGSTTCTNVQLALDAVEMNTQVPPCPPDLPWPSDRAVAIEDSDLVWFGHDPNADVLTYDVFVEAGDPTPDVLVCNDVTEPVCDPGPLTPDTTYFWQVVANDGTDTVSGPIWRFTTTDGRVAGFPFYDGFESGKLGRGWSVVSIAQGEALVSDYAPYAGTYSVLLDDAIGDTTNSTTALILTIDLAGQSDAVLDFWWREFSDENHNADGVFISDDGVTWVQVLSFNDGPQSYQHEVIDLDQAATNHGLTLNDHFRIKFQFYDNYPVAADGYAIDEVRVQASSANPPYVPRSPTPDDGSTNVSPEPTLSWTDGDAEGDSVTYDVYLDTVNPPTTLVCNDVAISSCAPGTLALGTTYYWRVVADDGSGTSTSPVWQFTTVQKVAPPFYEDFESGDLGPGWWTETTNEGRVRVGSIAPYAGAYSALLDDSVAGSSYSIAALVLLIDLAGQSDVTLDFWWREFNDEYNPEDGVFISDDNGVTWVQVLPFSGNSSSYQHAVIDLDQAAVANGLTLNDHFLIKFQFYDNFPISTDGYAIDEVRVIGLPATPTATPSSTPTATPTSTGTPTFTLTPTTTPTATATPSTMAPCDADYDDSQQIDIEDLILQAQAWRAQEGVDSNYDPLYDPIHDGVIHVDDLMWVARYLGTPCGGP